MMRISTIVIFLGLLCQGSLNAAGEGGHASEDAFLAEDDQSFGEGNSCRLTKSTQPLLDRLNPFHWTSRQRYVALGVGAASFTLATVLALGLTSGSDEPTEQEKRQDMLQGFVDALCNNVSVTAGWMRDTALSVERSVINVQDAFQNITRDACDRSVCASLVTRAQTVRSYVIVGLETTIQRLCVCLSNKLMGTHDIEDIFKGSVPETIHVPSGSGFGEAGSNYTVVRNSLFRILDNPSLCSVSPDDYT